MPALRLIRAATVATVACLTVLTMSTGASAASADRTPPTTPVLAYYQGYSCLTLIVGVYRSTDNVTPQDQLTYVVYDNGVAIGTLVDRDQPPGPWGILQLRQPGNNTVTVQTIDAAGNRSALSPPQTAFGYYTSGCTSGTL